MKIGLIVNPIAGLGGRVGLKGSDGEAAQRALALGAVPEASLRAATALAELLPIKDEIEFLCPGGPMGSEVLSSLGFSFTELFSPLPHTTAWDTERAAGLMRDGGAALILFVGGDGTARNIFEAVGDALPVIGVPAGVKIHSGVYAVNPRNAGLAALDFIRGKAAGLMECEVMDIDEDLFREGRVAARLYGYMKVPAIQGRMQSSKSEGASDEEALLGMAGYIVDEMEPGVLYLIGPGSTTRSVMADLGLPCTLLGVDVVKDRTLLKSDAREAELWDLLLDPAQQVKLVVTVIGGQGNLFGRGNQQFSPRILRRVGKKNVIVCSARSKLMALSGRPLRMDTGDPALDREFSGYVEIVVDYEQTMLYKVSD